MEKRYEYRWTVCMFLLPCKMVKDSNICNITAKLKIYNLAYTCILGNNPEK